MGSLGVYLASHYASAPMDDKDEIPDWLCACIGLAVILAAVALAATFFYVIICLI